VRRAIGMLREQGPDNLAAIVQDRLAGNVISWSSCTRSMFAMQRCG
jgi:hypothetical protein